VSLGGGYDPRRRHKQELIRFMVSLRILRDWNSLSRQKFTPRLGTNAQIEMKYGVLSLLNGLVFIGRKEKK
jgi:hypothetical protein